MLSRSLKLGFGLLCALVLAQPATAAPMTETLNTPTSPTTTHTDNFGTVTLTQMGTMEVMVTVTLASGEGFHQSPSFGFNITGDPTVSIATFSNADYSVGSPNQTESAFGTYDYTIACSSSSCNGGSKEAPSPLTFDVSVTSGTLLVSDFAKNSNGYYYFAQILGGSPSGNTLVAAFPEPPTYALFAASLLGLFFLRRRTLRPARISRRR